jgi:hypothetical protein
LTAIDREFDQIQHHKRMPLLSYSLDQVLDIDGLCRSVTRLPIGDWREHHARLHKLKQAMAATDQNPPA